MSDDGRLDALKRLAASYGVQWSYRDMKGEIAEAEPEPLLAVLRALGAGVERLEDVELALRARRRTIAECLVPPVVTLWDDAPAIVPLKLPPDASGPLRLEIALERGESVFVEPRIEDLPVQRRGAGWMGRLAPLPGLPHGYHRLRLEHRGQSFGSTLIRAPRRAYRNPERPPRTWGLFAPLYGLASRKKWGMGDLAELGELIDLAARSGASFAATLPLYAGFRGEPSPYSPASRLFWNELYLDPTQTPEWERSETARELARGDDFMRRALAADATRHVDYDAVHRLRRPVLEALARQAERDRAEELAGFAAEKPSAVDYARFRASIEREHELKAPSSSELAPAESPEARFHLYAQLAMSEQMDELVRRAAGKRVGLYFDLPLGVHGASYDVWRFRASFAEGVDVGAPPDPVFTDGQSWGFPPVVPEASRASGHEYFRLVLAQAMRHASLLRIDHVMGLHRTFWIPAGFEKRRGVYVRQRAEELYAVVSLESHRARCEVVGENLGIVPESVERSLEEHDLAGLYVLQYSLSGHPQAPARPIPDRVVASLNTHDTPPFAGFCKGRDVAWRQDRDLENEETAARILGEREREIATLDAVLETAPGDLGDRLARWLRFLLASRAERVMIALEDLWLEEDPQNVPGTTSAEHANWTRKLRFALSELPDETLGLLDAFERRD